MSVLSDERIEEVVAANYDGESFSVHLKFAMMKNAIKQALAEQQAVIVELIEDIAKGYVALNSLSPLDELKTAEIVAKQIASRLKQESAHKGW